MGFLRKHWYDIGGILAILAGVYIYLAYSYLTAYQLIVWLSLVSLFLHQVEEYRLAGTFPGMVNKVLFGSKMPDRYPLNPQTAMVINVVIGWGSYTLAAVYGDEAVWLGIATILVSLGNVVAHTFIFNTRGKTVYNAGMATSVVLFAPLVVLFFLTIHRQGLVTVADYMVGVPLGILLNYFGILKLIDWMKDARTGYVFPARNLLPEDR